MKYYVRLDIVYPVRYTTLKLNFRNEVKDSEMFDSIEQAIECANQIIDNIPKNLLVSEIKNFGKCNDLETYEQCKNKAVVTLCSIKGAGHTWSGGDYGLTACQKRPDGLICNSWKKIIGKLNSNINASEMMWEFFSKYSLP